MTNWFKWKKRPVEKVLSDEELTAQLALSLISKLADEISDPEQALKVFSSVDKFNKGTPEEQMEQLPAVFLLLAQYLIEVEKGKSHTRNSIIRLVKNEYRELLKIKGFALIFADAREQEILLSRKFISFCLEYAYPLLGDTLEPVMEQVKLDDWNEQTLYDTINPNDQNLLDKGTLNTLRIISLSLFKRLENTAGIVLAQRVFENSYEKMGEAYGSLDTYSVIIHLLPKKVLDEKKLSMLTQHQAQKALLENLQKLEDANNKLELKNLELEILNKQLFKAKEELDIANKAKSMFLASMSHELRTPLTAVIGFSQILESDSNLNTTQRYYTSIINQSGSHLLSMINDVLDLTKIEAGQLELSEQPFNLHSLLNDLKTMFSVLTTEKDIDFKLTFDSDLPRGIKSDSKKIKQILINLLSNAVKYTQSGYINLTASVDNDTGRITFKVQDSGVGIPEHKLHEIFDPFKQLQDNETKGTGLGLSISQKLATLLGGYIEVESVLNEGSTFTFDFPYTLADEKRFSQEDIEFHGNITGIRGNKTWNILVGDDDENNRALLQTMLESVGFKTTEATNGMECMEVLHTSPIDLVLLDLSMPVMDGHETLQKIRTDEDIHSIPVIAVTAGALKNQEKELINEGFNDIIIKPFIYGDFFQKISQYLNIEYTYSDE